MSFAVQRIPSIVMMQNQPKKIYDLNLAREAIKKYCAYQERSQRQVVAKLKSFGLLELAADELLLELIAENFLNELRFSEAFARGKSRIKSWGPKKIENELRKHGVSAPCIAKALAALNDDESLAGMQKLAEKKWLLLHREDIRVREQKVIRFLLSKGYNYDAIKPVVAQLKIVR